MKMLTGRCDEVKTEYSLIQEMIFSCEQYIAAWAAKVSAIWFRNKQSLPTPTTPSWHTEVLDPQGLGDSYQLSTITLLQKGYEE